MIPLSAEDLTKVRIASSPLWETVGSFEVLVHHGRHTVHAPWVARARRVLPGTDLSALLAAMCVERACPDFLSPPPRELYPEYHQSRDARVTELLEPITTS